MSFCRTDITAATAFTTFHSIRFFKRFYIAMFRIISKSAWHDPSRTDFNALSAIDRIVPDQALLIKEVLDFLVSDVRIKPGELDAANNRADAAMKELEVV